MLMFVWLQIKLKVLTQMIEKIVSSKNRLTQ